MASKLLSKKDRLLGVKDVEGQPLSIGDRILFCDGSRLREGVLACWVNDRVLWVHCIPKEMKSRRFGFVKKSRDWEGVSPGRIVKPTNQKLPKLLEKRRQFSITKDIEDDE
jgi:hypothetical protein